MTVELETGSATIVMLGNFNPAIFHPAWFVHHGLATEAELDNPDLNVVHPEISQLTIGMIEIMVQPNRFSVTTASSPWIAIADLLTQLFVEILPHTPIKQAGINSQLHYRLPSIEDRVAFGRKLAPIGPWGQFGQRIEKAAPNNVVNGVQILAMREHWIDEPWSGWNQIKLEPSTVVANGLGVYIETNHHIQPNGTGKGLVGPDLVNYISRKFDSVKADADFVAEELFQDVGR